MDADKALGWQLWVHNFWYFSRKLRRYVTLSGGMGEEAKIEINGLSGTSAVDNDRVSDQLLSQQQSANSLSFHNIVYTVKVGKPCKKVDKVILRNVSGIFEPGLNAIMGPTGGGKTSLLDLLAKRKDSKGLEGEIMLNGKMVPKNFKLISGLVIINNFYDLSCLLCFSFRRVGYAVGSCLYLRGRV